MTVAKLYLIIVIAIIVSAIIVAILLSKTFKKIPTINLVQGKLKDKGDDIDDAMKHLKITNLE